MWIDISPPITEKIAVFPGDVAYRRKVSLDFKKGHHLLLSSFESTLHLGAHADAANHYHAQGEGIEARDVGIYLGRCQVIHVIKGQGRIGAHEIQGQKIQAPRILFRTDSFLDPEHWHGDFRSFDPDFLNQLADQGVRLVGIDTPSVDPEDSKGLEAHQVLFRRQMAVLEGLVLSKVSEGLYTLIAPPLRLIGADASPVRALLHPNPDLLPSSL